MSMSRRRFLAETVRASGIAGGLLPTAMHSKFLELSNTLDAERRAPSESVYQSEIPIQVNCGRTVHTMAGGAGASWHAIGPTAFWYDHLRGRINRWCRGSVFGGNPPLDHGQAWADIYRHVRWLGLNFIRVEIDMRMYHPAREVFDWNNVEMLTLYRILDNCQANHADVFFTQMWQDVDWNCFEGVSRLQSAPKSISHFVTALATLMEHLIKIKGYTCIRWLCISNEPGHPITWWLGPSGIPQSLMPALKNLRTELDKRGLSVALSGPDWSSMNQNSTDFDFDDKVVGAHDAHNYSSDPATELQSLWARRAHERGIPFFQSEFGTWNGDDPLINPTSMAPKSFANQLTNAEKVLRGIGVGVDGFNRWSFLNRGDLDGQWQLVRTWDPVQWEYHKQVEPEPTPYFCYGIITRFMAKYSDVLEVNNMDSAVVVTALRSPNGNLTIYIINTAGRIMPVRLNIVGMPEERLLHKYQVQEMEDMAGYRMDPSDTRKVSAAAPAVMDSLPAHSITVYSTYNLRHEDIGIMVD